MNKLRSAKDKGKSSAQRLYRAFCVYRITNKDPLNQKAERINWIPLPGLNGRHLDTVSETFFNPDTITLTISQTAISFQEIINTIIIV